MKQDFTIWRNQILQNPRDISPLKFGMSQDEVIEIFGKPDAVSTMRSDGKPLILKYCDIELHFDRKAPHGLYLVYCDDEIELSITDHHDELLQPITNIEPVDNEFFLQDGAVYFSGLYENGLLKGVSPKDFCCWHYWGKSSTACFLGGIRLRGADPASFRVLNYAYAMDKTAVYTTSGRIPDAELATFQVLDNGQNDSGAPQGYAKDSRQVYFHNGDGKVKIIKGAEVSSFRSLGDTYFARDEKRIYAYGKQLLQGGFALMGIAQSLVFPRCQAGVLPQPGDPRGRIGTVLRYAPRRTHPRLPTIWPVTRNIFTKTMR